MKTSTSNCCNAELITHNGDEGTSFYTCSSCQRACDIATPTPTLSKEDKLDGRKARHFDCDWNNDTMHQNACGICRVCKYLDFLDYAGSVGKPEGTTIQYNRELDKYIELKTISEKQGYILQLLKQKERINANTK